MIDEEVETVLREIRERVTSQPLAETSSGLSPVAINGDQNTEMVSLAETTARSSEAIARLNAHLTTTARAWDRLPPVFSNRSGTSSRIEVWIKARLKRFSRWFTWEQINFNAAVHHALIETLKALTEQDAVVARLRSQLSAFENNARIEGEALRGEIQRQRDEIDIHQDEINSLRAQLQADVAARRTDGQNQQREANGLRAEIRGGLEAVRIQSEDQQTELSAKLETAQTEAAKKLAELAGELRERQNSIENEQRVCFKQLSLETNETAIAGDRALQRLQALLEEMNQRIKRLEDSENRNPGS